MVSFSSLSSSIKQRFNIDLPSASSLLIASISCLMVFSLLMVASASVPFTYRFDRLSELHFFYRQLIFMGIGLIAAFIVTKVPLKWVYTLNVQFFMLVTTVLLLLAVIFIGTDINGSKRWLDLGPFNFQPAELAKLVCILFTANFVVRRSSEVRSNWAGFARLCIIISGIGILLLAQPDFGSLAIIGGCVLAIFYVGGAPRGQFSVMASMLVGVAFMAVIFAEYRLKRVMSFWDPFDDIKDTDYQLSRSLIAFGRGEFSGVGYGESVQKLAHLPEAHTDFLLAITGEEFGFLGVLLVILLEAFVIASIMRISFIALKRKQLRFSYTTFGIATMFIGQTAVNAGMNMGLLPTKGLTLPFFSYGGSSMLMCLVMIGLVLHIAKESATIPVDQCRNY